MMSNSPELNLFIEVFQQNLSEFIQNLSKIGALAPPETDFQEEISSFFPEYVNSSNLLFK